MDLNTSFSVQLLSSTCILPSVTVWKLSQGSKLCSHGAHFVRYPCLRNHCPSLLDVHYLKNFRFIFSPSLLVSGGRVNLVLVLGPQLLQGVGQPALELPLLAVVDLHQPRLVAALGLTQLLEASHKPNESSVLRGGDPAAGLPAGPNPGSRCRQHFNLGDGRWSPRAPPPSRRESGS